MGGKNIFCNHEHCIIIMKLRQPPRNENRRSRLDCILVPQTNSAVQLGAKNLKLNQRHWGSSSNYSLGCMWRPYDIVAHTVSSPKSATGLVTYDWSVRLRFISRCLCYQRTSSWARTCAFRGPLMFRKEWRNGDTAERHNILMAVGLSVHNEYAPCAASRLGRPGFVFSQ